MFAPAWALRDAEPVGLQLCFPQLHAGLYNKGAVWGDADEGVQAPLPPIQAGVGMVL